MEISNFQYIIKHDEEWFLVFADSDGSSYDAVCYESKDLATEMADKQIPLLWGKEVEKNMIEIYPTAEMTGMPLFTINSDLE